MLRGLGLDKLTSFLEMSQYLTGTKQTHIGSIMQPIILNYIHIQDTESKTENSNQTEEIRKKQQQQQGTVEISTKTYTFIFLYDMETIFICVDGPPPVKKEEKKEKKIVNLQ